MFWCSFKTCWSSPCCQWCWIIRTLVSFPETSYVRLWQAERWQVLQIRTIRKITRELARMNRGFCQDFERFLFHNFRKITVCGAGLFQRHLPFFLSLAFSMRKQSCDKRKWSLLWKQHHCEFNALRFSASTNSEKTEKHLSGTLLHLQKYLFFSIIHKLSAQYMGNGW